MREQIAQQPLKRRASAQRPAVSPQRTIPRPVAQHSARVHADDHSLSDEQETDDLPDSYYQPRQPLSVRRYHYTDQDGNQIIQQGNRRIIVHTEPPKKRRQFHWLFFIGIGMFVMLSGWIGLMQAGLWWTSKMDTWTYEYPRVYQTDAIVGHTDSSLHESHFIALNLDGHVQVIEIPGGDASHEKVYIGPVIYNDPQGLLPVTVSFSDVNGDGKPDMLIHIQDQTIIFFNNGTEFVGK